jgi:hypothetical protein
MACIFLTATAQSLPVVLHGLVLVNDVEAPHSSKLLLLPPGCLYLHPFVNLPNI